MSTRAALVLLVAAAVAGPLADDVEAQLPSPPEPDSSEVALLDELVVTADRAATPIASTVGAVTRLDAFDLLVANFTGLPEALRIVPGFSLVDRDGGGLDPQPIVRGFYGGGETDYVVVMVDGKPLNALQSGLMAWDLVDPVSVEAVEVVRGPTSALYGDAAVGGIVNFITTDERSGAHGRLLSAGHGLLRGGARLSRPFGGRTLRLHGSGLRSEGFRDHGRRAAASAGISYDLVSDGPRTLTASLRSAWRGLEQPGPLSASQAAADRTQSDVFYSFDEVREWVNAVDLNASWLLGGAALSAGVTTELRRATDVRTLPLAPDFADTKERDLGTDRFGAGMQLAWDDLGLPWPSRLVAGIDASWGLIDSEYFSVATGAPPAYASTSGERGAIDASGEGRRSSFAPYTQLEVAPGSAVRLTLGVRYDRLSDRYEPRPPSTPETLDATHTAVSPKVGVSVRWLDKPTSVGRIYISAGRSFKAATPDQLFDQRSIPLPFPPFSATTSNPTLVPQRGVNLEAGAYHSFASPENRVKGAASLAVYQLDMKDELDFDLATLRYVNIGESRHRGVEAGLTVVRSGGGAAHASYALQSATSRAGTYAGRQLKAIPRHTWSVGVSLPLTSRLGAGFDLTRQGEAWLDDQNEVALRPFTRANLRFTLDLPVGTGFIEARNLFDARYNTTGFLDPSGTGTVYYYPAAGRTLGVGIALDR